MFAASQTGISYLFCSPFVPKAYTEFCGSNDLHFLTFSCYRRRPLFRNQAYCDLFLKLLERIRRRYRLVVLG
jgi:hypothetical protein